MAIGQQRNLPCVPSQLANTLSRTSIVGRKYRTEVSSASLWKTADLSVYLFLPGFTRNSAAVAAPPSAILPYILSPPVLLRRDVSRK